MHLGAAFIYSGPATRETVEASLRTTLTTTTRVSPAPWARDYSTRNYQEQHSLIWLKPVSLVPLQSTTGSGESVLDLYSTTMTSIDKPDAA